MIGMYDSNDPKEVVTSYFTNIIVALVILAGTIFGYIAIYKHYTKDNSC